MVDVGIWVSALQGLTPPFDERMFDVVTAWNSNVPIDGTRKLVATFYPCVFW